MDGEKGMGGGGREGRGEGGKKGEGVEGGGGRREKGGSLWGTGEAGQGWRGGGVATSTIVS